MDVASGLDVRGFDVRGLDVPELDVRGFDDICHSCALTGFTTEVTGCRPRVRIFRREENVRSHNACFDMCSDYENCIGFVFSQRARWCKLVKQIKPGNCIKRKGNIIFSQKCSGVKMCNRK